jgi:phage-related tail fiber protein
MSQHDMDVANQAGAAFRADMNLALQALASTSAGTTEPAVKFPCQLWADTTTGLLKIRNAANSSWITMGDFTLPNSGLIQPGAVIYIAHGNSLNGYLKCNGGAISRTTYANLYAAIGTTYGVGDGSTTFNLPELRGEFIRGLDDSRGIDAGRALGSAQSGQNLDHTHVASAGSNGYWVDAAGLGIINIGGATLNINRAAITGLSSSGAGNEARPRNVAMYAVIKI